MLALGAPFARGLTRMGMALGSGRNMNGALLHSLDAAADRLWRDPVSTIRMSLSL